LVVTAAPLLNGRPWKRLGKEPFVTKHRLLAVHTESRSPKRALKLVPLKPWCFCMF